MIVLCYTIIEELWNDQIFEEKLGYLSQQQRDRISSYKDKQDKQLRVQGRLLAGEVMKQLGIKDHSLPDLKYDEFSKPYLDTDIDFNISHSGKVVVCAGITGGKIGVDVEMLKPIDIADVKDVFLEDEWSIITNSNDPIATVYKFWTRKEAVLKAAGKGILGEPLFVDASKDKVPYENSFYNLYSIHIKDGYVVSVATDKEAEELQVFKVD